MLDKTKCVTFSGYRPEKLPDGGDENQNSIKNLKGEIRAAVLEAVEHGYNTFLTGMAEGFDLIAAEEVLALRDEGHGLRLIAVCPFDDRRNHSEKYNQIIQEADDSVILPDHY